MDSKVLLQRQEVKDKPGDPGVLGRRLQAGSSRYLLNGYSELGLETGDFPLGKWGDSACILVFAIILKFSYYYFSHFIDKETKPWRDEVAFPKSALQPGFSCSKDQIPKTWKERVQSGALKAVI